MRKALLFLAMASTLFAQSTEKVPPQVSTDRGPKPKTTGGLSSGEKDFWNYVKDSADPADFKAYLKKFPRGFFADLARNRIKALTATPEPAPAPPILPVPPTPGAAPKPPPANVGTFAGQTWADPVSSLTFCWIPAGSFDMGSDIGDSDEKPIHRVTLTKGFWMGKTEITQSQWLGVMGDNPSSFQGGDKPVENVSWNDAKDFLSRLNDKGGKVAYRLPTEAEWEYACRAVSTGDRYGNLDAIAWHDGNSGNTTHPVGQKQANTWGLQDMLGNVWEWCEDWFGSYASGSITDSTGPRSGSYRVGRGGSWIFDPANVRSAYRGSFTPDGRSSVLGFRVVAIARTP